MNIDTFDDPLLLTLLTIIKQLLISDLLEHYDAVLYKIGFDVDIDVVIFMFCVE